MPLCRLMFFARPADGVVTEQLLYERALYSRVHNARSALTGCLVEIEGWLVEYLEGRRRDVNEAWSRVLGDQRHRDAMLVSLREIDQRQFAEWGLCAVPREQMQGLLDRFLLGHRFEPSAYGERTYELLFSRLAMMQPRFGPASLEIEFAPADIHAQSDAVQQGWQTAR